MPLLKDLALKQMDSCIPVCKCILYIFLFVRKKTAEYTCG